MPSLLPPWTLKEIWLFDKVMSYGSVTTAAADMDMTQSAASRILTGLEEKLATSLFDRVGRNLVPNDAAFRFHGRVRRIIEAVDERAETASINRHLSVAVPPSFAAGFIQDAAALFLSETPNASITVEVRSTPGIEELIADGTSDLGISDGRLRSGSVRAVPFRASTLACFLDKANPLARRPFIGVEDLDGQQIILFTRRHRVRSHIVNLLEKSNATLESRIETSTGISALWHVKYHGGIAFMSAFPVRGYLPDGIVPVAFHPALPYRSAFLLPSWRGSDAITRSFIRAVRKVSEKQSDWSSAVE